MGEDYIVVFDVVAQMMRFDIYVFSSACLVDVIFNVNRTIIVNVHWGGGCVSGL